ncbi:fibroblast growth factor receptor substrate 2-like [Mya arenaria]|uniref:fibroblast growth factor receptor substrate 2-like n=1 Tax=Mya arenaria TaxID=6604 RepID=UPI0022DED119|nr:fibroblast growth factor receptor substrate 2-like [Mya arenaria]
MGCHFSKNFSREVNSRVFKVHNVNDLGAEISPGKIEVTETDLIFFQRGREPVRWPLRCLRRYGFDEELFSFESGRRCPTGSGIYAFKCRRAEELFNLVQEAINNVGANTHIRGSQTIPNGTNLHVNHGASRPTSLVDPHEPNGIRLSNTGRVNVVPYDQHLYINGNLITPEEAPNYVNTGANNPARTEPIDDATALIDFLHDPPTAPAPPKPELVNYADLDLPKSTENIFEASEGASGESGNQHVSERGTERGASCSGSSGPEGLDVDDVNMNYADLDVFQDNVDDTNPNYINIDSGGKAKERGATGGGRGDGIFRIPERKPSIEQNYANVGAASFTNTQDPSVAINVSMNPNGGNMNGSASMSSNRLSNPCGLNYIVVDVNKTESDSAQGATASNLMTTSLSVPDSPSKKTEAGYALIDFNRTVALSNSARPVSENEEGLRKTRHNSTIN